MKRSRFSVSVLAPILLLCVFAVSILFSLHSGTGIYGSLSMRDRSAYEARTCAQYLTTKVRQAAEPVRLTRFGQGDALVLHQTVDGVVYETTVYCHDGWLRELFAAANSDFSPTDGEKLLPADSLQLEQDGSLLRTTVTAGGRDVRFSLFLPLWQEERP